MHQCGTAFACYWGMHTHSLQLPELTQPTPGPLWQHQLGLLLESTGEGIFGIDLDGNCVFINQAGARQLGYEVDEVLGHNMHWLTHHSHADGSHYADTDCPIFNAFRQGLPCRIDREVFWRKNRVAFPVEYSSYPILEGRTVLGAVITFVDITERRRADDALLQAKQELESRVEERTQALSAALEQLRELSAHAERVREEERTRIAREVHDELGSLLVALKMDVNWLHKRLSDVDTSPDEQEGPPLQERMRSKCRHMSTQIESAVENVGRIITDLRPSILDHQGLWAALDWQAHEFVQSSEMALHWQMDIAPGLQLPEAMAIEVFRIFQEMLSNVGRHSQASQLRVQIQADAQHLTIRVQDNGRGASLEAFEAADAYGIMGMRERALRLNGSIQIESQVGQGCTMELRMPLHHA
jgi:PAS domain S-box-containing protein